MNFKEILELIDRVSERGIASVEIEQAGTKLRIEGRHAAPPPPAAPHHAPHAAAAPAPAAPPAAPAAAPPPPPEVSEAGLHIITSPIVGTFYRSPNPEAESFANVGDRVTKGKVLCIIEAMKLMNEIEADVDGVVAEIYPQNAQAVEYGEPLLGIDVP